MGFPEHGPGDSWGNQARQSTGKQRVAESPCRNKYLECHKVTYRNSAAARHREAQRGTLWKGRRKKQRHKRRRERRRGEEEEGEQESIKSFYGIGV